MIRKNSYITIQAFMVKDLKLKGNELLIYALIYGFCQDGRSVFSGTARYIAEWVGIDKRNVFENLRKLVNKGLIKKIEKEEGGLKLVDYKVVYDDETSGEVMNHQGGDDESSLGGGDETSGGGSDESSPHNIDIDNIILDNIEDRKKKEINIKKKESLSVSRCSTDDKTLIDLWNGIADRWTLPKIISITPERRKKIRNILKVFNIGYEEFFKEVEEGIMGSDFLRGKKYRWNPVIREYDIEDLSWRANFDFFLRESSYRKTVEGMYESADVARYKKEGKWENVKRMWLSNSNKN